jgi:DNA-binding response OmpR family regulator
MVSNPKGRVLVVDDEAELRFVLSEALRLWGYDVVEAADAVTARAIFARERPIAVVTDINLPDGSGLDLLREFKRHRPSPAVIVITGDVIIENTISALRGDADDFISKPIDVNELQMALAASLAAQEPAAPPPPEKLRVLVVSDVEDGVKAARAIFNSADAEIAVAKTSDELRQACNEPHELAVLDLEPGRLEDALRALRASELHRDVPLLVSSARLVEAKKMTGLLPRYRAMPCSPTEMAALVSRRALSSSYSNRRVL